MATQNPIEMEGTYPLPEAQLDRFLFKALVPVPSSDDLVAILRRTTGDEDPTASTVADVDTLNEMARMVREVPAATHLLRYAAQLVAATQPDDPTAPPEIRRYVRYGSSPRGAQALILGGKASALLDGRPNLAAEDIWAVAHSCLRHRLVLGYEAVADDVASDQLIDAVLQGHPEPQAEA
jgi:MoxR-like ATPase